MAMLESHANDYLTASVVTPSDHMSVIHLRGELDTLSAEKLRQAIDALPAKAATVAVDLAAVDFIDAGGMRALVCASTQLRASSRDLIVVRPTASATRLFDLAEVDLTIDLTWDGQGAAVERFP